MAIGDLLGKFKKDKPESKKFLALEITDEVVQAAVWHVQDSKTELVTTGPPVEWDGEASAESELLSAVDATISGAVEGLANEPSEVIFGVTTQWTQGGGLEKSKLKIVKKICEELELKALGFVVILDSVIRHLKLEEGTPATSILMQVGKKSLTVALVKLGKVEASTTVERSDNVVADTEGALSQLKTKEPLPSRVLIFNSMHNLEEIVQKIVSHDWEGKFNFLHVPSVSSLARDVAIRSVAVAGGAEVAKAIGFSIIDPEPTPPRLETKEEESEEEEIIESNVELATAADFGFSSGLETSELEAESEAKLEQKDEEIPVAVAPTPKMTLPKFKLPSVMLPKLQIPKLKLPQAPAGKKIYLVVAGVLLLMVTYFAASWYVPKAIVRVNVTPKPLEESLTLTLATDAPSVDATNHIIPGVLVEHSVSGEESMATTGDKTIGDPARGEITIYNRTSLAKSFPKGTPLLASGGASGSLKFTLDADVVIASKSAGVDYVDVPGKATVKIVASVIGSEGNLKEGTEFTIAAFSKDTYVAKNDSSLSGGSSKEVRVVAEDDVETLVESLKNKLLEQAKAELELTAGEGGGIYIVGTSAKVTDTTLSSEVGEEANELIATVELTVQGVKYNVSDVETLVSQAIDQAVPPGYIRTLERPTVEIGNEVEGEDDQIEAQAKVIVQLVPSVDTVELQNRLRGVRAEDLESLLESIPGLASVEVAITPNWLPPRWKRMPRNPQNITIFVQPT